MSSRNNTVIAVITFVVASLTTITATLVMIWSSTGQGAPDGVNPSAWRVTDNACIKLEDGKTGFDVTLDYINYPETSSYNDYELGHALRTRVHMDCPQYTYQLSLNPYSD